MHGDDNLAASKAIRESLKELDNGIGEKMSLLKMLVIKCDEADQNYNRLRNYINYGELENADKYVTLIQINLAYLGYFAICKHLMGLLLLISKMRSQMEQISFRSSVT